MKTFRSESKGKSSTKVSEATDELQYLMNFNASITQAAARAMEHLTDFVFISMGNLTLYTTIWTGPQASSRIKS